MPAKHTRPSQSEPKKDKKKRTYISQSDVPKMALRDSLKIAEALRDDFAGRAAQPHQLALAVDVSPTSSNWQRLCGASIAYGLTSGGYNASEISLTDLGRRVVTPTEEGDDAMALVQASLTPRIAKEFFARYDRAKFPQDRIGKNVLSEMGVPPSLLDATLEILKDNGRLVGVILETKTGPYVAVDNGGAVAKRIDDEELVDDGALSDQLGKSAETGTEEAGELGQAKQTPKEQVKERNNRVFIAHGKNTEVVEQLKKILAFGKFEPVVAVEHQSTAIPVPEKVLQDMRRCCAGILHLCSEEELLDREHKIVHRLNENVLIEIGAAMALYGGNFILLVQKGVHVPSNLQGLQRCEYEGTKLDVEATMKLLAAFNEFK